MTIDQAKILLRTEARARRAAIEPRQLPIAAASLAAVFAKYVDIKPADILAGFWPTSSEIDCRALMTSVFERGHVCALPVVTDPASPITFFAWRPGLPLVAGPFGIMEPEDKSMPLVPTIILVPLLAFDPRGHRLGYGGGYYDRTIELLRHRHGRAAIRAIGVAFDVQRVDNVPHEIHDQRLDGVITETTYYDIDVKAGGF